MSKYTQFTVLCAAGIAVSLSSSGMAKIFSDDSPHYLTANQLSQQIQSFAGSSSSIDESSIGTSLNGSPIHLITISSGYGDASKKPAILITAGLDGRYLSSTESAMRIAHNLIEDHSTLLDEMTVYIIPQANPDGAARNTQTPAYGYQWNARSKDDDRDRAINEDGPDDLNGDGLITMMRRLNPPINDPATHLADPDDPRLNIKPDQGEGQRAEFTVYPEGLDNDLDGEINEDGFGGVDLDSNFMHGWPEHQTGAGQYPLSEPESLALAQFVLDHDNIVMALTLGRHDNLVNQPNSKSKDITGKAPLGIDAKDADLYKAIGELYTESTEVQEPPKSDISGSFHAWLYAQRGIPSFAAVPWTRPAPEKTNTESDEPDSVQSEDTESTQGNGLTPSGVGDISMETLDELREAYVAATGEEVDESMISNITPEMVEGFAAQAGIVVRRVVATEPEAETSSESGANKSKSKKKSEDAKWLEYFDQAGVDGFVAWTPYEHPTLGSVEIGGFAPLARINPPAGELDSVAQDLTDFVVGLIESRPVLNMLGPEVTELTRGVYEVHFAIVNDGKMPTSTAHSSTARTNKPTIIQLSTGVDQILTGQRVSRVWGIDPHGGRSDHHWIIRTENIGNEHIQISDPRFGNRTIELGR